MTRDMRDKLEKFAQEHREQFDSLTPKESIWEEIRSDLDSVSKRNYKVVFWQVAAIFLFVFSISLTLYVNRETIFFDSREELSDNTEFINTELYYTSIIQERQELIKTVAANYPDIESDFESDWLMLDATYAQLKKEYKENQSVDVLHALVQNLQSRVNLLNKQLEVVSQIKTEDGKHVQI